MKYVIIGACVLFAVYEVIGLIKDIRKKHKKNAEPETASTNVNDEKVEM